MKLDLQTPLNCAPEVAWQEVKKLSLLQRVAEPVVTFTPLTPFHFSEAFSEALSEGASIQVKMVLFGFIPLGVQTLTIERIDDEQMEIQSREHHPLIRKWDHLISIQPTEDGKTLYSDSLDVEAGILTLPIWLFAHYFYRHRQSQWRKLAQELVHHPS